MIFSFWQKLDKFLATIDMGKEDRMELEPQHLALGVPPIRSRAGKGSEGWMEAAGLPASPLCWNRRLCRREEGMRRPGPHLKAALPWLGLPPCLERWLGLVSAWCLIAVGVGAPGWAVGRALPRTQGSRVGVNPLAAWFSWAAAPESWEGTGS